jgi:transcription elongation factor Elf1
MIMQIGYSNDNDKNKRKPDKKLFGCPACHTSRYVVLTSTIRDKRYHYRELYCHSCNISFSPHHAVSPFELKE